jgi:hypothetical protein
MSGALRGIEHMITIRQLIACAVLSVAAVGAASGGTDDPVSRLKHARSLRCTFTSEVATWVRSGHRTVEQTTEKSTVSYDNIDLAKGTARIIANDGASDLSVWWERFGSLWMLERTPSGNIVATTVFPMYAEGTNDFVVLEARHSITGAIAIGQDTYGTCKLVE